MAKGMIITDYKFWNGAIEKLYQLNKLLKFDFYVVSENLSNLGLPLGYFKFVLPNTILNLVLDYDILFTVDRTITYARYLPRGKLKHIHYCSTFLHLEKLGSARPDLTFVASRYFPNLNNKDTFYLGPIIDLREHFKPSQKEKHRVLFIGNFYRNDLKNLSLLNHLASCFPEVEFLAVGRGTEEFLKDYPNLRKLGYLLRPFYLFEKSSIFILPSKKDTNPVSLYHALVNGLQVLTVPIPQVIDEVGRFIEVSSLENFTAKLRNLLKEGPKPNYEGSNFCRRKYSLENYKWAVQLILED